MIVFANASFAQKESNVWIFADSCGLDFNGPNNQPVFFPTNSSVTPIPQAEETFGSIADSAGSLLFYIGYNGPLAGGYGRIYNHQHQLMDGGLNMYISGSSTNGATIIPFPGNGDKYYVFYQGFPWKFNYGVVDMSLNGGLGKVIQKNIKLDSLSYDLSEKVIAIQHANGRDWWILTHPIYSKSYFRRLITPQGIDSPLVQQIGLPALENEFLGEFALGPRSEMIACVSFHGKIETFDFDRCTGLLSRWRSIGEEDPIIPLPNDDARAYGCSLSPSGRFLYVSSYYELFQYDLWAVDIKASKTLIYTIGPSVMVLGQHQLGPDGKIYICIAARTTGSLWFYHPLARALSVISEPDQKGQACDFRPSDFDLQGKRLGLGLPSPPHYGLGPLPLPAAAAGPDHHHACPGDSSQLGSPAHPDYLYSWEPAAGLSDPNLARPVASPKSTTTYILTVFDTKHACRNVNTDTVTVTVNHPAPGLTIDAGPDLSVACPGDELKLGTAAQPGWWYRWSSTAPIAAAHSARPKVRVHVPAWYYLEAGDDLQNLCRFGRDSIWVDIDPPPLPLAYAGRDRTICPGGGTWLQASESAHLRYLWQPAALFSDPRQARVWLRPQSSQQILLQVTDTSRSCHNVAYDTLKLTPGQIPYADAGPDMRLCDRPGMSDTIGTTALPHAQYLWEPPEGLSDPGVARPLVFSGEDRIYRLTVVKDTFCVGYDSLHILHQPCDSIWFPTAFSPNGDGINDVFYITNLPPGCVFRVWNRWGRLLYDSASYGNDWDGKNAPEGVYVYRLVEPDGRQYVGSVTIIR